MYVYSLPGVDKEHVIDALDSEADRLRVMAARQHANATVADMYNNLAATLENVVSELRQTSMIILVSTRVDQGSLFDMQLDSEARSGNLCNKCGATGPVPVGRTHYGCGGVFVNA